MFSQDWWDDVKNELEKPGFDKKKMGNMFDEMFASLGDRKADGHGAFRKKFVQVCISSTSLLAKLIVEENVGVGAARLQCIILYSCPILPTPPQQQRFAKDMESLLGRKGSQLFEKRKDKSFIAKVNDLLGSMREFQKEPGNLKEYSPWLSGFKADPFRNELEIPGLERQFFLW